MIPVEEILEALDLPAAPPGIGYLRTLFERFNARVPFESASKILRHAAVPDPDAKPRTPDVFWSEHIESGTGGTCFARVAAFDALLEALGFQRQLALGRVESDFDHAALRVALEGEEWIADVGFPLPALFRGVEEEIETPQGAMRVTPGARGWRVELVGGVPEGPRALEVFNAPVTSAEFLRHWRRTFRPTSKFLTGVTLRKEKEGRTISFARGEIRVDDRHSRTRLPLAAPRAAALEEQFGVERGLLERALAITADPEPDLSSAEVTVYLSTGASPDEAFEAIASPEGYRRLMEGVARVAEVERTGKGWRLRLVPPATGDEETPGASIEEEILPDPEGRSLRVRRGSRESFYEAFERGGRTFLARRLALEGLRPDLLRNDSLRGRFAGSLAVDLLAWARMLATV